jgi:3-hydroxyacyl-[acyl-carrier-protein] dehydratase
LAGKKLILDPSEYDLDRVVAGLDEIRRYNQQRFEMEQLTAVVHEDHEGHVCVGYKDVSHDEFWIRGHMPAQPLMPGVLICEAAAQLASYFAQKNHLMGSGLLGFGGIDEVKFREPVLPGSRLVIVVQMQKSRRNVLLVSRFQCFVRESLVAEGVVKGIAVPEGALRRD